MMATILHHPALPPMPAIARILSGFDRDKLASFIEVAIGLLDVADGDVEAEDGDEDRCTGFDDHVGIASYMLPAAHSGAGDPADAEEDDWGGCEHDGREPEAQF